MKVTMSTVERNHNQDEAQRLIEAARALRAQYLMTLVQRLWARVANGIGAMRAAHARRDAYRALSTLDRHTLMDVGLDRMAADFGPYRPANENRPRNVA
jgi:uncharacterized protein YjiS (DUF1127 family)